MPVNRERERLATAIRAGVPPRPGVYLFKDERGDTVYVGKAVDLKKRMLSYFLPGGADPRARQMSFAVRGFEYRETATELLALLLEDALIKRERPRYNVRGRDYEEYRYLVVTDDAYPTCRVVAPSEPAPGAVFGPFRDWHAARSMVDFLGRQFRLRSCVDPRPFRRSANYDLGLCAGPCREAVSVADYAELVGRAVSFLNGDGRWLKAKLARDINESAQRLAFEEAAGLQAQHSFAERFCRRQRFIARFRSGRVAVRDAEDTALTYVFEQATLREVVRASEQTSAVALPEEIREDVADQRWVLDRANIVYGWLTRRRRRDAPRA